MFNYICLILTFVFTTLGITAILWVDKLVDKLFDLKDNIGSSKLFYSDKRLLQNALKNPYTVYKSGTIDYLDYLFNNECYNTKYHYAFVNQFMQLLYQTDNLIPFYKIFRIRNKKAPTVFFLPALIKSNLISNEEANNIVFQDNNIKQFNNLMDLYKYRSKETKSYIKDYISCILNVVIYNNSFELFYKKTNSLGEYDIKNTIINFVNDNMPEYKDIIKDYE